MGMDCKIFFTLAFMCLAIVQSWATAQLPVSGTNEWPVCCLFAPDDHPTNILYQEHCESSYCGIKKGMTVAIVREECCEVQRELHFKPGTRCVSIVGNPKSCRLSESCRSLFWELFVEGENSSQKIRSALCSTLPKFPLLEELEIKVNEIGDTLKIIDCSVFKLPLPIDWFLLDKSPPESHDRSVYRRQRRTENMWRNESPKRDGDGECCCGSQYQKNERGL